MPTAPVDPELPIRGRYVRLRLVIPSPMLMAEVAPEVWLAAVPLILGRVTPESGTRG